MLYLVSPTLFYLSCSILIRNCPRSVTNTKCNLTLFVIPCKRKLGDIDLQYCNYCHLLSEFSSKFQSSMLVIHYINVWMQSIPEVDELKVKWDDNIRKLIHKKRH